MYKWNADEVTREEFITMLWRTYVNGTACVRENCENPETSSALFNLGRVKGWLEEEDELFANQFLERRAAARILHEFLRKECGEKDCENWDEVWSLKDILDCRVCLGHIAQVYVKGIMDAKGDVFGMREHISQEESRQILGRLFDLKQRRAIGQIYTENVCIEDTVSSALRISVEEAKRKMREETGVCWIDVRSAAEYEKGHPKGAVNLTMTEILEHPEQIGNDKNCCLILSCNQGYQSEIAAKCLAEAGYKKVFYLGMDEELPE